MRIDYYTEDGRGVIIGGTPARRKNGEKRKMNKKEKTVLRSSNTASASRSVRMPK